MAENNNGSVNMPNNSCPFPSCGCLGYGYVPVQELNCMYDTDKAICNGTVFPELDLDICEYGCVCKGWGGTQDD